MTFSLVLAAIPFLILILAVAGLVLGPRIEAPQGVVLDWVASLLPVTEEVTRQLRSQLIDVVESSRSVGLISAVLFVWFSTRLFGSLRTALDSVFDFREGPGILRSKLIDIQMVVVATILLTANVGITTMFLALSRDVVEHLPIPSGPPLALIGYATAFAAIFLMFFLIYKFVPTTRLGWRTAGTAALVAAVGFELLKAAFGWYLAEVADFTRIFFAFATLVILVVSLYYVAIVFVLGAEMAKVYDMRRTMRRQREEFEPG